MEFNDNSFDGTCSVCGKKTKVVSACCSLCPVTLSYCKDCYEKGLEPYNYLVDMLACCGLAWPNAINDTYKTLIKRCLTEFNISEEQFAEDVNKAMAEVD